MAGWKGRGSIGEKADICKALDKKKINKFWSDVHELGIKDRI